MADSYTPPGGKSFGTPTFSDAVPPTPPNQGDKGPNYYTDEHTFESGSVPANTGAIESNWSDLVDTSALGGSPGDRGGVPSGLRGYRPTPVGGSYNPGQGTSGRSSKGAMTQGSTEKSGAS